jgi:hypothetical protein
MLRSPIYVAEVEGLMKTYSTKPLQLYKNILNSAQGLSPFGVLVFYMNTVLNHIYGCEMSQIFTSSFPQVRAIYPPFFDLLAEGGSGNL